MSNPKGQRRMSNKEPFFRRARKWHVVISEGETTTVSRRGLRMMSGTSLQKTFMELLKRSRQDQIQKVTIAGTAALHSHSKGRIVCSFRTYGEVMAGWWSIRKKKRGQMGVHRVDRDVRLKNRRR